MLLDVRHGKHLNFSILRDINNVVEQILYVFSCFGGNLIIWHLQPFGMLLRLLKSEFAFLQVDFVADHDTEAIANPVVVVEFQPGLRILEGPPVADVDYNESTFGILQIIGDKGPESFLPGCVPQLQAV